MLDEVEKAHSDVFNILLQILDDGRLTDSKGRTVDFKNTVIIMTSNLGSAEILNRGLKDAKDKVLELLKSYFRPEFLNRIDDIIVFDGLTKEQVAGIAGIMLKNLAARLQKQLNITLQWDEAVLNVLAQKGYDPAYGARPLRRQVTKLVETELSKFIIRGEAGEGNTVKLSVVDEDVVLKVL